MTKSDEGTQMFGKATETVFVEDRNDVLLTPRKFQPVDEISTDKLNKIKVIQRYARRYLLKKRVKKYAAKWRYGCCFPFHQVAIKQFTTKEFFFFLKG